MGTLKSIMTSHTTTKTLHSIICRGSGSTSTSTSTSRQGWFRGDL